MVKNMYSHSQNLPTISKPLTGSLVDLLFLFLKGVKDSTMKHTFRKFFTHTPFFLIAHGILIGIGLIGFAWNAHALVIRVSTVSALQSAVTNLTAGDTLILESGVYEMSSLSLSNLFGTLNNWITITAEGAVVIRGTSYSANVVEIRNCQYLKVQGLEITSTTTPDSGIDGIKITQFPSSYITFEDLYIHHVSGNGISIFSGTAHHISLKDSEIAYASGSGLYWGYPGRDIVYDSLIDHNYIHHCPVNSSQSTHYGIQIKGWSYRMRIEDNVLHDVGGTSRSGIIVYYGKTPLQGDVPGNVNIVRGNVLWNCRSEGITAMSDALIENNIVFDAAIGIHLQQYTDESFSGYNYVENLTIRNNTIYRCSSTCVGISGWNAVGTSDNVTFTGNAAYQNNASANAISGSSGQAVVGGNLYYGNCSLSGGVIVGNGLSDFVAVSSSGVVPQLDFYPSTNSALLNVTSQYSPLDFNGIQRPFGSSGDAGAYEWTGANNPGWHIQPGMKQNIFSHLLWTR